MEAKHHSLRSTKARIQTGTANQRQWLLHETVPHCHCQWHVPALHLTGTGNRSFGEKTVKKNQLRHKIRTTESDFESFMEDNGRGQWGR